MTMRLSPQLLHAIGPQIGMGQPMIVTSNKVFLLWKNKRWLGLVESSCRDNSLKINHCFRLFNSSPVVIKFNPSFIRGPLILPWVKASSASFLYKKCNRNNAFSVSFFDVFHYCIGVLLTYWCIMYYTSKTTGS